MQVHEVLVRSLKKARNDLELWQRTQVPTSEEDKVLLHQLVTKHSQLDESVSSVLLPHMTRVAGEDDTYTIDGPMTDKLLILLLKREVQHSQDEVKFEQYRTRDMEHQVALIKDHAKKEEERSKELEKKLSQVEELEKRLEIMKQDLIQVVKERDEYKNRIDRIIIEVEEHTKQCKERVHQTVQECVDDYTRCVNQLFQLDNNQDSIIQLKRQMAETIDNLRLCIIKNF